MFAWAESLHLHAADTETTVRSADEQAVFAGDTEDTEVHGTSENRPPGWWFDDAHRRMSNTVKGTALWFDGFFGDERDQDEQADASLRMRFGWEPDMKDIDEFPVRFRLKIRLPLFRDRFDLIFSELVSGEEERMPLEAERPQGFGAERSIDEFQAALRWMIKKTDVLQIDTRAGARSNLQPFFRARYQTQQDLYGRTRLRLTQTAYWEGDDGFGLRTLFETEYRTADASFLRSGSSIDISQQSDGLEWAQRLEMLHQIGPRMAVVPGGGANGKLSPRMIAEKYTFSVRYRHNVLRHWFYYEMEPFVDWLKEENFVAVFGIAFRIEVYFSGEINPAAGPS